MYKTIKTINAMKKLERFMSVISICFFSITLFAQSGVAQRHRISNKATWVTVPFTSKAFVENKGQFDNKTKYTDKIYYGGTDHGLNYYFTKSGLIYVLNNTEELIEDESELSSTDKVINSSTSEEEKLVTKTYAYAMEWVGANPNTVITVDDPTREVFHYMDESNPSQNTYYKLPGYRKLTYKNIYPNIDLEYTYHSQNGIKYKFILHPGADPNIIRAQYDNSVNLALDNQGNIHISTVLGDMIDHAPAVYYSIDNTPVGSGFNLENEIVGFNIQAFDHSKIVVIDPWVSVPTGLTVNQIAYDIGKDNDGNVYVHGGTQPFKVQKLSVNGTPLWTYTTTYNTYLGDLVVDTSGNCYVIHGFNDAARAKIDSTGAVQWSASGGITETWALSFNCDYSQLVVAGHQGPCGTCQGMIAEIDMNTGAMNNITYIYMNEIRTICTAPNGDIFGITNGLIVQNQPPNKILRCNSTFTPIFEVISGYSINELGTAYSTGGCCMGFDGTIADNCYLYTTDGSTFDKRDKSTGLIVQTVTIPTGIFDLNAGVAVDSCGNLYVGSQDSVYKYDNNFNLLGAADATGRIYDVKVNSTGEIVACGPGYVSSVNLNSCSPTSCAIIGPIGLTVNDSITDATCGSSNGDATAYASGGNTPYTYDWSNGQTNQTATGLATGTYYVTVYDSTGCLSGVDTVFIDEGASVLLDSAALAATCDLCNGTATVIPSGGVPPFTYLWDSNTGNQTDSTATGLCPGTYSVTITDADSCIKSITVTVIGIPPDTVNLGPDTLLCEGEFIQLDAGTGTSYQWSTSETSQQINVIQPGEYYVNVTDTNGCNISDTIEITYHYINLDLPAGISFCPGDSATIDAGNSSVGYQWSTGATTSTIVVNSAGQYWVIADDGGYCNKSDTIQVSLSQVPDVNIEVSQGICATMILKATGDADLTFEWSTGEEGETIIADKDDTYWVDAYNGDCHNFDTVDVNVEMQQIEEIIPNVFTPNNDGLNDELKFQLGELKSYDLQLFNRWGKKIYTSTDVSSNWDGKINGRAGKDGIYYYILTYESLCDGEGEKTISGYVTLLR